MSLLFRRLPIAYRILGFIFLELAVNLVHGYLFYTDQMRAYIHFFRVPSALQYTLGSLYFLFVRYLIYPDTGWKRWYWLLFFPALAHLEEMMPFYLLPAADKLAIYELQRLGQAAVIPQGFLGFHVHVMLKTALMLTAVIFSGRMWWPILKNRHHLSLGHNNVLFVWLLTDWGIKLVAFGIIFGTYLFHRFIPSRYLFVGDWLYFADSVFNAAFLLANPRLLQGVQWRTIGLIKEEPEEEQEEKAMRTSLVEEVVDTTSGKEAELMRLLNQIMQYEELFLNEKLTVERVANQLGVKSYRVSRAIKETHGISFTDFINSYRLDYIDRKLKEDPIWKSYSIESMAFQAGFGSRTSFYAAFKKMHNTSPTAHYGLISEPESV